MMHCHPAELCISMAKKNYSTQAIAHTCRSDIAMVEYVLTAAGFVPSVRNPDHWILPPVRARGRRE